MIFLQVFYSLKARCGDRLSRGDFALTSDSVVLAVQDHAHETADGGRAIIAVVELQLRVPDGSLPSDFPFRAPWRPAVSDAAMQTTHVHDDEHRACLLTASCWCMTIVVRSIGWTDRVSKWKLHSSPRELRGELEQSKNRRTSSGG